MQRVSMRVGQDQALMANCLNSYQKRIQQCVSVFQESRLDDYLQLLIIASCKVSKLRTVGRSSS